MSKASSTDDVNELLKEMFVEVGLDPPQVPKQDQKDKAAKQDPKQVDKKDESLCTVETITSTNPDGTQKIVTTTVKDGRTTIQTRIVNLDGSSRLVCNDKTTSKGSHPKDCFKGNDCEKLGCKYTHPTKACAAASDADVKSQLKDICRNGGNCHKQGCQFVHPAPAPIKSQLKDICRNGGNCHKQGCQFVHPDPPLQHQQTKRACRDGGNCQNQSCKFGHPIPAAAAAMPSQSQMPYHVPVMCHFGLNCTNIYCKFLHPARVVAPQSCKFGLNCKKIDSGCTFNHPARAASADPRPWEKRSGRN